MEEPKPKTQYQLYTWGAFKATDAYKEVGDVLAKHGYRLIIFPGQLGYGADRAIIEKVG